VAIATLLVGWFGFAHVGEAVVSIGWKGFALLAVVQVLLFGLLGVPWAIIAGGGGSPWVYVWARTVRDSATNCLPFSPVGGFLFGTRVLTLHGVAWPLATASMVVDVTAEVLAQMLFALLGLCLLLSRDPGSPVAIPLALGVGAGFLALLGFFWVQQGASAIFAKLGRRIAGHWFDDAADRVATLQGAFGQIYGRTWRLALGTLVHLVGWVATALGSWLAYRLVGADLDFEDAVVIEALLRAMLAATFVVPGNAGVQEAGYAGLGLLFGVPPDLSISISLISRARDLVLGIPVLLVWQWVEVRRLRPAR
jgi:putative membrane protein